MVLATPVYTYYLRESSGSSAEPFVIREVCFSFLVGKGRIEIKIDTVSKLDT